MNIQKISFGGAYRLHCKNKAQAENIKKMAPEHHLGCYQSKKGKKENTVYIVTPDTMMDIRALTTCALDASTSSFPAEAAYAAEKNAIRENIEKQILKNAIDITL